MPIRYESGKITAGGPNVDWRRLKLIAYGQTLRSRGDRQKQERLLLLRGGTVEKIDECFDLEVAGASGG